MQQKTTSQLTFKLNGEEVRQDVASQTGLFTIDDLLKAYSLDARKIAIERNLEIVRRSKFSETIIDEGDNIEIIHFIGGG